MVSFNLVLLSQIGNIMLTTVQVDKGKQFSDLRAVFSVHNEPFQIWASKKSGIKNFKGLKKEKQ